MATIHLQYLIPGEDRPRAGYEITDAPLEIADGSHTPRVGEYMQIVTGKGTEDYVVLAVNTRLYLLDGQEPGWVTYITLGPGDQVVDQHLTIIRE